MPPPIFPFELVLKILNECPDRLYLLNKKYTEEYVKIHYANVIVDHSKIPIFKSPMFPYYSYITQMRIIIRSVNDTEKWKLFPFNELTHCSELYLTCGKLSFPTFINHDPIDLQTVLDKIKIGIPNLKYFKANGQVIFSDVLQTFQNSKLEKIYLPGFNVQIDMLNKMTNLTYLWIENISGFAIGAVIFPNITKLQITDFEFTPDIEKLHFFSGITTIFPKLNHLMCNDPGMPHIQILSLISKSVSTLELALNPSVLPYESLKVYRNTISINFATPPLVSIMVSVINYFKRKSKYWVFAITSPATMITNLPTLSDFNKFKFALDPLHLEDMRCINRKLVISQNSVYIHRLQAFENIAPVIKELLSRLGTA